MKTVLSIWTSILWPLMEHQTMTTVGIGVTAMTPVELLLSGLMHVFFKNVSCGNNIIESSNTILYIKQGGLELLYPLQFLLNTTLK